MSRRGETIRCRAAIAYGTHQPLVVEDILVDPPKHNEVRIKIKSSALCRSDLHILETNISEEFLFPLILGHEGAPVLSRVLVPESLTSVLAIM